MSLSGLLAGYLRPLVVKDDASAMAWAYLGDG